MKTVLLCWEKKKREGGDETETWLTSGTLYEEATGALGKSKDCAAGAEGACEKDENETGAGAADTGAGPAGNELTAGELLKDGNAGSGVLGVALKEKSFLIGEVLVWPVCDPNDVDPPFVVDAPGAEAAGNVKSNV